MNPSWEPTNADLRIEIAILKRDLDEIKRGLNDVKADIATLKSYFIRGLLTLGGLILVAAARWILMGGLAGAL